MYRYSYQGYDEDTGVHQAYRNPSYSHSPEGCACEVLSTLQSTSTLRYLKKRYFGDPIPWPGTALDTAQRHREQQSSSDHESNVCSQILSRLSYSGKSHQLPSFIQVPYEKL